MKNIIIFLLVLSADQTTKYIAAANMDWRANTGISFGLFPQFPLWIFFALIVLILFLKIIYKIKFDLKWALFMAGICGNLIDRVRFGYVVDWIPLPFPFMDGLRINIADAALISGFICYILSEFKKLSYKQPD